MTQEEFYDTITALSNEHTNRDLETYLLALYNLVESHQSEPLTPALLFQLLGEAFSAPPIEFDAQWLSITASPDRNILSKKFTNPDVANTIDKSREAQTEGIDYTREVLRFQIAELHKMRGKQLDDDMRYFGIPSETGNYWYNFDPFTNLECGARGILDNSDEEDETAPFETNWDTLGDLLEMGRIYE